MPRAPINDGDGQPLLSPRGVQAKPPGAGFIASCANLANAAVGAGVLALPDAFKLSGVALGPILALVFAALLGFSLHVLGTSADYCRQRYGEARSYQEIVTKILGTKSGHAITALQLFYLTGSCIAYLIIMRDQLKPLLVSSLGEKSRWCQPTMLIVLVTWLYTFPLCLIRRMALFGIPSTLSQLGIFYTVAVVIYHCVVADFGKESQLRPGTMLVVQECNALTEELWHVGNGNSLVLNDAGGSPLCASFAQLAEGAAVTTAICAPKPASANQSFVFSPSPPDFKILVGPAKKWCLAVQAAPTAALHFGSDNSNAPPCLKGQHITQGSQCMPQQIQLQLCTPQNASAHALFLTTGWSIKSQYDHHASNAPLHAPMSLGSGKRGTGCVAGLNTDTEEQDYGKVAQFDSSPLDIFIAIPMICFSFFCHATFPLIYDSLENKSLRNME